MSFLTRPQIEQVDARNWLLLAPLVFEGRHRPPLPRERWEIEEGSRTDLASSPSVTASVVPPYGVYTAEAVLHDRHCEIAAGLWPDQPWISRRDADGLFRRNLRDAGVSFPRRWCMWAGVRCGGGMSDADVREWATVLLVGVLVVPWLVVLLLPTALLMAGTWLVERLFGLLGIE